MPITSSDDWKPYERGYHVVYREHEVNHCPGCGRTHWIIGRISAECAFCATALPLAEASMRSHDGAGDHPAQERRRPRLGGLSALRPFLRTGTCTLHRSTPPAGTDRRNRRGGWRGRFRYCAKVGLAVSITS